MRCQLQSPGPATRIFIYILEEKTSKELQYSVLLLNCSIKDVSPRLVSYYYYYYYYYLSGNNCRIIYFVRREYTHSLTKWFTHRHRGNCIVSCVFAGGIRDIAKYSATRGSVTTWTVFDPEAISPKYSQQYICVTPL